MEDLGSIPGFGRFPGEREWLPTPVFWPGELHRTGSSAGKESTCSAGDSGSIPDLGRSPGEGIGYPLQYFCLKNPHGQRNLVGCSPWSCKESDKTEQLSTIF